MTPLTSFGRLLGLILILDAALLLSVLGRAPLSRIDEGQIAEVSREMVTGRDWATPRIGGIPFPAYPPLAYWVLATSGSALGFTEFAMRLPTALAALALIAVAAGLTRRLAGDEPALFAATALASTPAFFVQSSVCRADVLTMLFATAAFDRFLAWADGGRKQRDLALMYLFTALGILTKGPLTIATLGLGGLSWFLLRREWKLLLAMRFWIGIPAVLLIVVPWYYAMFRINGPGFLRANLLQENLNAFTEGFEQKRPWTFYLRQLPLLLPWLLLIPLSWKTRRSPGVALSFAWFGLTVLFFNLSSAKRINYMTYWCPPLAMTAGTTLSALCAGSPQLLRKSVLGLSGALVAGGALVAALPASIWTGSGVSRIAAQLPLVGVATLVCSLVIAATAWRRGPQAACVGIAAVLLVAFFGYGFGVNPRLSPENREAMEFCRRIAAQTPPGERIQVPAPEGAVGLLHFYVGYAMPLRDGAPGLYLATQTQEEKLVADGKRVQILDSMLDHRGRYRYFLRVHP